MKKSLASIALSLATLAAVVPGSAAGAPLANPVESGRYTFDRSMLLPTPALSPASPINVAGGLREGGLSSLQVIPGTGTAAASRAPTAAPTVSHRPRPVGRRARHRASRRSSMSSKRTTTGALRSSRARRSAFPDQTRCASRRQPRSPAISRRSPAFATSRRSALTTTCTCRPPRTRSVRPSCRPIHTASIPRGSSATRATARTGSATSTGPRSCTSIATA